MIILNASIPLGIWLTPNPNTFKVASSKLYSQAQTLGGWIYEHWGDNPLTLSVSGITKAIVGDWNNELEVEAAFFALKQLYHLDKRSSWDLLGRTKDPDLIGKVQALELDSIKKKLLSNTNIYYRWDVYSGFFTRFDWENVADMPRVYKYNFEFLVTATAQNFLADKMVNMIQSGVSSVFHSSSSTVQKILPGPNLGGR